MGSVRRYGFQVIEHDEQRPWIIIASRHEEIELPDGASFLDWAAQTYPRSRHTIDVDPWTLSPKRGV